MSTTFSITLAIKKGWQVTTSNFGLLLGSFALVTIPPQIVSSIFPSQSTLGGLVGLAVQVYTIIVSIGMLEVGLKLVDGKKATFSDLFNRYQLFFRYLGASILYILGVVLGLILLIVPGVWFAARYGFYAYVMVDKDLGLMDSLKESARITEGKVWQIIGLSLASLGVIMLGFLALILGIFVAYPVVWIASAWVYRQLSKA